MFLICSYFFVRNGILLLRNCIFWSTKSFFGQKGDSLGQIKYFLTEKVIFLFKNVFLDPLATSGRIILTMISEFLGCFKNFSKIWPKKILYISIKNSRNQKIRLLKFSQKILKLKKSCRNNANKFQKCAQKT